MWLALSHVGGGGRRRNRRTRSKSKKVRRRCRRMKYKEQGGIRSRSRRARRRRCREKGKEHEQAGTSSLEPSSVGWSAVRSRGAPVINSEPRLVERGTCGALVEGTCDL